jgi:hypothetical protein
MIESKDAYYFSHDANARNDSKMLKLRRELGIEGYGIYFCLVEILREQKDFCLNLVNLVDIAYSLHIKEDVLTSVVSEYGLFELEGNKFFSKRLIESMEQYKSLTNKRIDAGRKGGLASAKQRLSKKQANVDDCSSIKGKEKKGKEKKGKEVVKTKYRDFVFLSQDELIKLQDEFGVDGTSSRIDNLNNYAHQKFKKFKEYTSHYHTILSWERKNGHQTDSLKETAPRIKFNPEVPFDEI